MAKADTIHSYITPAKAGAYSFKTLTAGAYSFKTLTAEAYSFRTLTAMLISLVNNSRC
nr:hypothetical protein [uncultured Flavobacterium sp.]